MSSSPTEPPGVSIILHRDPLEVEPPPLSARSEAAHRLDVFYDLTRAADRLEDTGALLDRMLKAILDVLGCERGLIGRRKPGGELAIDHAIVQTRAPESAGQIVISRSLLQATLHDRDGVIACDELRAPTMLEHKVLSAMAAPLTLGPNVIGLVYVDERLKNVRFTEADLKFLRLLAYFIAHAIDHAERYQRATAVAEVLRSEHTLKEIIGDSAPMQALRGLIQKYAGAHKSHVMIRGESGTGKELVAQTLHALSPRRDKPLVTLNCAAMPDAMVESELFGHVKGAFTGAVSDKRGKFVLADKGTLFLDEIGDLSLAAQAKVLRAVQQGEVQPVGSERTLRVDVRILSATHKDLEAEVKAGRFREDLFYRLNLLEITVPPLRERAEDIPRIAYAILPMLAAQIGKRVVGITPDALSALVRYRFPGNVRELKNELERGVIVAEEPEGGRPTTLDLTDLSARITGGRGAKPAAAAPRSPLERYQAGHGQIEAAVKDALELAKGNVTEAARLVGISRRMMITWRARLEGRAEPSNDDNNNDDNNNDE